MENQGKMHKRLAVSFKLKMKTNLYGKITLEVQKTLNSC